MAAIKKGAAIVEHQKKRLQRKLESEDGVLELGGNLSPLHQETPWKRGLQLMKIGDLRHISNKHVASKTPSANIVLGP